MAALEMIRSRAELVSTTSRRDNVDSFEQKQPEQ